MVLSSHEWRHKKWSCLLPEMFQTFKRSSLALILRFWKFSSLYLWHWRRWWWCCICQIRERKDINGWWGTNWLSCTRTIYLSLSHSISFVVCLLACPLLYLPLWLLLLLMSVCGSCTHSLSVSVCISIFYMYTECIRLSSVCLPINLSTFFVCTVSQSVSCIGTSDCM